MFVVDSKEGKYLSPLPVHHQQDLTNAPHVHAPYLLTIVFTLINISILVSKRSFFQKFSPLRED